MQHVTEYIQEHLPDVPILIAGNGDRVLTIAAKQPDIIGLTGGDRAPGAGDPLAERIEFVRNAAPDRFDALKLNVAITAMPINGSGMPDLKIPRRFLPDLTDEDLLRHPGVLSGSTRDMADGIRGNRDTYGVSYIIVQAPHAGSVREGDRGIALNRRRARAPMIDRRNGTSPWVRYAGVTNHSR